MSKYLLVIGFHLALGIISVTSNSQDIVKTWNLTYYDEDFSPEHPFPTWTYYSLKTDADTSINSISYRKLLKSNDSLFSEISIIGGIREELGRIYLSKSRYSPREVLLYDFNLNVSDTTEIYRLLHIDKFSGYYITAIVDSVNSIYLKGDQRKQLFIEYQCIGYPEQKVKDIWIEGIGSVNNGFLNESCMCYIGCYTKSYLTCFFENNILYWTNSDFDRCVIDSSGTVNIINELDQNPLKVSINPNPVIDISRIGYSDDFEFANVYDIMGRHMKTYRFNGHSIEISRSDFKSGLYMLVITCKDNRVFSQKLLVK